MSELSNRIKTIQSMVPQEVGAIWDLCCDHGHIGEVFIKSHDVYFVDQIPSIIDKLKDKLTTDIPSDRIILKSVLKLKIYNKKSNCFILAGIGSYLAIEMIKHLLDQDSNADFVISTHKNELTLRKFLHQQGFNLLKEDLIFDNGQYYQIFHCRREEVVNKVELIPKNIFNLIDKKISVGFIKEQINLFEKKAKFNQEYQYILDHYTSCLQKFQ